MRPKMPSRLATGAGRLAVLCLCVGLAALNMGSAFAEETVTLRLQDGRELTARIDPRSDDDRLWLRFGNASIRIRRPIPWNAIAAASQDDRPMTIAELRALAADQRQAAEANDRKNLPPDAMERPAAVEPSEADELRWPESIRSPVSRIQVDVYAANWDADVEVDGLVLHVRPLDRLGRVARVSGTLDVELSGLPGVNSNTPRHGLPALRRLGVWTRPLDVVEATDEGFVVELPFQAFHPQFDDGSLPYGLVQARLTVPGDGVFSATCDGVRLRPYSPLRDAQQRATGRRFLPHEQTGRGKR